MSRTFQLVNIFPALTVRETLAVAVASRLRRVGNPFRSLRRDNVLQADVERIAEVLGLRARLETVASTLSQGEKKLLDIASAFALNPSVILLDEPTSGVSTGDKHTIMEVLVSAAKAPVCAASSRSSTIWTWSSGTRIASSPCRKAECWPICRHRPSSPIPR